MQRRMFGTPVFVVFGTLAAGLVPVVAQDPPATVAQDPPVTVAQPPVALPVAEQPPVEPDLVMKPEPPVRRIDPLRRREQIISMEGLLTSAVKSGATAVSRQMQAIEPGIQMFTGTARAKGFYIEDYGVFFHVEIPGVAPSAATISWLMELERNNLLDRGGLDGARPTRTSSRSNAAFNADQAYVLAVQQRLIDALLDYRIDLHPTESVSIAAHDGEGPIPGQIVESPVMFLRLRASDIADFHAGRLTREEVRQRVEVREF